MDSGIGPTAELDRHNITQIIDLPVGKGYTDHPSIFTYWTIDDPNVTLGDGELETSQVHWLAGLPYDWISFAPAGEKAQEMAKEVLDPTDLGRYAAVGKMQVENFVLYVFSPS